MGNSFKPVAQTTTNADGTSTSLIPGPVTTEEKAQKKNDVKARSMLLMALPNEHLMTFNQYKDAKTLFAAIQTRFGCNDATKKNQKTLLKQLLLNKRLKELQAQAQASSSQNMAFVSSPSSTNEVNTAYRVSTANTQVSPASTQDLEQIHKDDIEEMDLKWQLALLSMRTIRFFQKTGRKITINRSDTPGYDKSKVKCFNCHKMVHFARECKGPRNQDSRNRNQDSSRRTVNVEETSSKAMVAIDGAGFDWSYMADDEVPTNMALMAFLDSEPEFEDHEPKPSKSVSEDTSNEVKESSDALLVEELVSDDKLEKKTIFPTVFKMEFVRPKQQEKPVRKPVKYAEMYRSQSPRGNHKNLNNQKSQQLGSDFVMYNKACFVYRSFDHVKANYNYHQMERVGHRQKEDQGYVDSGCSRHITGNMSYLSDFKEFDGGYVTFGGGAKGGKITGKGTLKIGKLDFEDVYFVKELQFNLFSVSQMCDKKNSVLFTNTGCFVLSSGFKLADKSQVLLKVLRKNNMYSVDMKNIIPKECSTYLVAKDTLDESMLWHRRLGHVNFKTINKLVKENLVRGLPSKHFENDQTCVACLKGKQHKASCKSKIQNYITQPLFILHMDLFGPTFMSSLMNKKYFLVVTDDYSGFTWVFFLASKDETSGILMNFITEIENLVDKKVKIIRCDNGTEFKNRVMSEFCE
ncbi:putative ribonuclease H-like domain-containing protein, partial [Tanacetum coccineum]